MPRFLRLAAVSLSLLGLLAPPALAQGLPQPGARVSGLLPMLGKSIPVPAGDWVVAAAGYGAAGANQPGAYGAIGGVLLVRPEPDEDRTFLTVHTNALPVRDGWGIAPACESPDNLYASVSEPRDLHAGCGFVAFAEGTTAFTAGLPALGTAGAARLDLPIAARLPPWAVVAGFRVSDRRDVVDMRLGLAPPRPDPAGWMVPKSELGHRQRVIVNGLADWTQIARHKVAQSMGGPAVQAAALPAPQLTGGSSAVRGEEETSFIQRGLYKLGTYRILNSFVGYVIATGVVQDATLAGWITFWNIATHSAVFMVNELAWEWPREQAQVDLSGWRPGAPDATPPAKLPPTVTLQGKAFPLPPGDWTVLAGEAEGPVSAAVLGRIVDGRLDGLLIARTNTERTSSIVGPPADCTRADVLAATVRFDTPRDGWCGYVKQIRPGPATPGDTLWAEALDTLRTRKATLPDTFLEAGARVRTRENFLDLRYYFAPSRLPAGTEGTDAQVAAMADWLDLLQEPAELGLRGRLPVAWTRLPPPSPASGVQQAIAAQGRDPLARLLADGAIDQAGFDRQLAIAEAQARERETQSLSLWTRSLAKVATYRVASTADTIATTWVVTGQLGQSLAIAAVNAVVKPVIAYANEIGWAGSGVGAAKASLLPASFPEIGVDRPGG